MPPEVEDNQPVVEEVQRQEERQNSTEGGLPPVVDSPVGDDLPPAPADAPPYNPNFSYKVLDEEKEFPEWLRSSITSEEQEQEIRDTYQKAGGIPHIKSRRDEMEQKVKDYEDKWGPIVQSAYAMQDYKQKKDLESLFEHQGLTDDDIFEYASKRLELRQNPDAFANHNQTRQLQLQNQQLQSQQQDYQSGQQSLAAERRAWELDLELSKPDVAAMAQIYDTRAGQPGTFKEEVIERGAIAHHRFNKDLSVTDAIQLVVHRNGLVAPQQTAPAPTTQVSAPRGTPPTLPNIRGTGTSPARVVPRSVADLRALAKQKRLGT